MGAPDPEATPLSISPSALEIEDEKRRIQQASKRSAGKIEERARRGTNLANLILLPHTRATRRGFDLFSLEFTTPCHLNLEEICTFGGDLNNLLGR